MRTIKEIDEEIKALEIDLKNTVGTDTEVYTRIVGYHRAVTNWNKGKRREYDERVTFNLDKKKLKVKFKENKTNPEAREIQGNNKRNTGNLDPDSIAYYNIFYSQFCRNCPPVKNYMNTLPLDGENFDVSSDLGLGIAREYNIMSTPAVLLFDADKNLIQKAHSVEEVEKIFTPVLSTAKKL